jgi:hypothetical protein
MRILPVVRALALASVVAGFAPPASAQDSSGETRQAVVEAAQAEKVKTLQPYTETSFERLMTRFQDILDYRTVTWHPYFESAAHGSGLALGVGRVQHLSPYNFVDVRGSYSIYGYKRAEAEFAAPRLFDRRGQLSIVGGWRDATQVAFYGVGADTSVKDHSNYGFKEGYGSALLTVRPTRKLLMLRAGFEVARWSPEDARGTFRPVEAVYSPDSLPGLGTTTTYAHSQGTVGLDWRPAPGY